MQDHTKLLYSASAIRKLEQLAIKNYNLGVATLMERAGTAVLRELKKHWEKAHKIVVVCGKGNNAGDGYVVARLARTAGLDVTVLALSPLDQLTGITRKMAQLCLNARVPVIPFSAEKLNGADVIVDALLGIGVLGAVRDDYRNAIASINETKIPVVAIDIPSGLNADTGEILGGAIVADLTVTFIGLKQGLVTLDGLDCCGVTICDELKLPRELYAEIASSGKQLTLAAAKLALKPRKRNQDKWCFGHVLIVGGDAGMSGAVRMAAEAALRVGAGLVTVATAAEHAALINCNRPEIMSYSIKSASQLDELLARATVVVLGPGLGRSAWSKKMWHKVITTDKPLVVDADGLNLLAQHHRKIKRYSNRIFTPHVRETARLLGVEFLVVQRDRFAAIRLLQEKYGGICILKGAGMLVKGEDDQVGVCTYGNSGMASGGMGDVLSGVIAGILAQGVSPKEAAELGALLHARAGDLAATEGKRGLIATDLFPYLRQLVN